MRLWPLLLPLLAAPARADEPPARARQERGTLVLTGQNQISASFLSYNNGGGLTGPSIALRPSLDVFVSRVVTLGGQLDFTYDRNSGSHSFAFGGGFRLGFYALLARRWALWPMLSLDLTRTGGNVPDGDNSYFTGTAQLTAPFLFYPAPGFFVGAGPTGGTVLHDYGDELGLIWTVGASTLVGGTF